MADSARLLAATALHVDQRHSLDSAPRNSDVSEEQFEKLLPEGNSDGEHSSRKPRRNSSRRCLTAPLISATFLVLFTLLAVFKLSSLGTTKKPIFSRRPDSEYVLTPDWDFDAAPTVREYHWTISDVEGNPDGVFRPMIVINGQFPGELIRCNRGDTIVVNVENRAVNATSIHWHGIFQNGTNWMDGTVGVTQCPIAPGYKFRYEFKVDGQAGTYFYHGHHAAQALDGLVGPIVIHSPQDAENQKIPYVTDRVVMLQDWYHDLSSTLLMETLSPGSESSPVPNGALLNGANTLDCSLHPHRRCDNSSAYIPSWDLAPDANHRLRLINVGGFAWFEVTVDNHPDLPITSIDGVDVEPSPEKSVLVAPGQRYSIVLSTNQAAAADDATAAAFWFRARMVTHCFAENVLPEQGQAEARAVIRYRSPPPPPSSSSTPAAAAALPATERDPALFAVTCSDMPGTTPRRPYRPVPALRAPERADRSYRLRVNLAIGDWRLERGFLNRSSFRPDVASPTLHRVLQLAGDGGLANDTAAALLDDDPEERGGFVLGTRGVEVVDIVLQNMDEGNHPFHLHGAQMFVLAAGHGYFPGYAALGLRPGGAGLLDRSGGGGDDGGIVANPVRRDVATVEGFGWSLVRFVADNPGAWLFHCHMVWHGEAGMAVPFLARLDDMAGWRVPEGNRRLCEAGRGELEKGALPKDEIWYGFGNDDGGDDVDGDGDGNERL